jgi:hypothetical protein
VASLLVSPFRRRVMCPGGLRLASAARPACGRPGCPDPSAARRAPAARRRCHATGDGCLGSSPAAGRPHDAADRGWPGWRATRRDPQRAACRRDVHRRIRRLLRCDECERHCRGRTFSWAKKAAARESRSRSARSTRFSQRNRTSSSRSAFVNVNDVPKTPVHGVPRHRSCAPGRTRTHDPLLRRQPLYPAELRGHAVITLVAAHPVAGSPVPWPCAPPRAADLKTSGGSLAVG